MTVPLTPLLPFRCLFDPSIIAQYENRSWSGVWMRPIRNFRISSKTSRTFTESRPFSSICNKNTTNKFTQCHNIQLYVSNDTFNKTHSWNFKSTMARQNICGFLGFKITHNNGFILIVLNFPALLLYYRLVIAIHTKTRHESTKQNVPERPMPAEQWTTGGPTFWSRAPLSRTTIKKLRNAVGFSGTPKSGHVV